MAKTKTTSPKDGNIAATTKPRRRGPKLQNGHIVSPFVDSETLKRVADLLQRADSAPAKEKKKELQVEASQELYKTFNRATEVLQPTTEYDHSKWGDPYTEEARTKAMKRFQRVVNWYNCASFEYAYASPEIRALRPRMVTLARILSATIAAHVADDTTTLAALEEVATPFLGRIGCDPSLGFKESFYRAVYDNPKDRMLDRTQWILCEAKGNEDGLDPKEYAATKIALNMFANHGLLFIDELPSDIDTSDKATVQIAERAIRRALRGKDVDTWEKNSRDMAENLIRAALYELGCRNARNFFDYLSKREMTKKPRAK